MTGQRILGGCLLAATVLIPACGQEAPAGPPVATAQEEIGGRLLTEAPEVVVLVVDDAPTAEAAEVRARVVDSVRAGLESAWSARWGGCGSPDPAQWHPGDIRFVIARPSAPDEEALRTPVQAPALAWVTQASLKEEIDGVVKAVEGALGERLAQPGEAYRPLRAARRAADLIAGAAPPGTPDEATFAGGLPAGEQVRLVIASARDDEDATPVADLALDPAAREMLVYPWVVGPFEPDGSCEAAAQGGGARLFLWGMDQKVNLGAWGCDGGLFWDDMLIHGHWDCGPDCHSRPVVVDDDGRAECRFFVDQPDLGQCDPARGWIDPDGEPQIVENGGEELRRCEIAQLTGAALDACRSTLECSGCGSGFCLTEVPELDEPELCVVEYTWPVRFVGGALDAPGGLLSGACLTSLGP